MKTILVCIALTIIQLGYCNQMHSQVTVDTITKESYISPEIQWAVLSLNKPDFFVINKTTGAAQNIPTVNEMLNTIATQIHTMDNDRKEVVKEALTAMLEATEIALAAVAIKAAYDSPDAFASNSGQMSFALLKDNLIMGLNAQKQNIQASLNQINAMNNQSNSYVSWIFGSSSSSKPAKLPVINPQPVPFNENSQTISIPADRMDYIIQLNDYKKKSDATQAANLLFKQCYIAQQQHRSNPIAINQANPLSAENYIYSNFPNIYVKYNNKYPICDEAQTLGIQARLPLQHIRQAIQTALCIANKKFAGNLSSYLPQYFTSYLDNLVSELMRYDSYLSTLCKNPMYGATPSDISKSGEWSTMSKVAATVGIVAVAAGTYYFRNEIGDAGKEAVNWATGATSAKEKARLAQEAADKAAAAQIAAQEETARQQAAQQEKEAARLEEIRLAEEVRLAAEREIAEKETARLAQIAADKETARLAKLAEDKAAEEKAAADKETARLAKLAEDKAAAEKAKPEEKAAPTTTIGYLQSLLPGGKEQPKQEAAAPAEQKAAPVTPPAPTETKLEKDVTKLVDTLNPSTPAEKAKPTTKVLTFQDRTDEEEAPVQGPAPQPISDKIARKFTNIKDSIADTLNAVKKSYNDRKYAAQKKREEQDRQEAETRKNEIENEAIELQALLEKLKEFNRKRTELQKYWSTWFLSFRYDMNESIDKTQQKIKDEIDVLDGKQPALEKAVKDANETVLRAEKELAKLNKELKSDEASLKQLTEIYLPEAERLRREADEISGRKIPQGYLWTNNPMQTEDDKLIKTLTDEKMVLEEKINKLNTSIKTENDRLNKGTAMTVGSGDDMKTITGASLRTAVTAAAKARDEGQAKINNLQDFALNLEDIIKAQARIKALQDKQRKDLVSKQAADAEKDLQRKAEDAQIEREKNQAEIEIREATNETELQKLKVKNEFTQQKYETGIGRNNTVVQAGTFSPMNYLFGSNVKNKNNNADSIADSIPDYN